jgi:hypothetical protein
VSSPREVAERALAGARRAVVDHPIGRHLDTAARVRVFTEHHVWAVWDFMWLASELRRRYCCTSGPGWVPPVRPEASRLVNEILLGEESDEHPCGGYTSHFDWYLDAMRDLDADTTPIERAVAKHAAGDCPVSAAQDAGAPPAVVHFLATTAATCQAGDPWLVGAFTWGRETLIPDMFSGLTQGPGGLLRAYLDRHIEVDATHGDHAARLTGIACRSTQDWLTATAAGRTALTARRSLWDATLAAMEDR